jgi:hypothetical protein
MKKLLLFTLILLAIQFSSCSTYSQIGTDENVQQDIPYQTDISFQTFYDDLSPYGQWINYPHYGNVWQPSVSNDFKPYATNGHWVYSDMGWTWVSGYSWGWATFHYGRWFFDNEYGWLWMPGYDWAPAWVSWRSNNDFYGWAPLVPNININLSFGSYNPPSNYWCFVPNQYINSSNVCNYYINENRNLTIINNSSIINNITTYNEGGNRNANANFRNSNGAYFATGPNPREVEQITRNTIRPVVIRDNNYRTGNTPINNRELNLFRPRVSSTAPIRNDVRQPLVPSHSEPFRDSRTIFQNNNNPAAVGRPDNRSILTERITALPRDSRPVVQNIQRPNSSPAERPDFRATLIQRRNEGITNSQVVGAIADRRTNSFNNTSNNMDPARTQNHPSAQPVVNNPRPVAETSGFRSAQGVAFNRNEYNQGQAPQPRPTVQQQTQARSIPQASSNRPFQR